MNWSRLYPNNTQPNMTQISNFISSPLWTELCTHLQQCYGVLPRIEHSICSGAPGWNVKYKKSSRALCTLYPAEGYFTAMVSIGSREATQAELLLAFCTDYIKQLYFNSRPFNGGRWLMVEVRSPEILIDVKRLIELRI